MAYSRRSLAAAAGLLLLVLEACTPTPPAPEVPPAEPPARPDAGETGRLGGRMLADAHEYPWSALARVNLAGQGFCTGVVVGPRQVLTQARCLYAEREGRWFRPFELHVVAAYQRDRFLADSKVADFTVSPGFNPLAGSSLANLASNWAVLTAEEPLGTETGWIGLQWESAVAQPDAARETTAFLRAGYRQDRPHAVSLHFGCSPEADSAAGLCRATPTELALPPFTIVDGELRVLADFYAVAGGQGGQLAQATGGTIGGQRLGRAQAPAGGAVVGRQPSATAATLLAALGYDVSGGRLGAAAAAFRRDNGLPAGEAIDIGLVAALLNAASRSGK